MFGARYEVLPYDLTSTCFESDAPFAGKRQFGCSRDQRSDCVQAVIALIVTPDGFPVAYEVMPGNTSDKTAWLDFMHKIEAQHGRSERVRVMDRGIPSEETLQVMRADPSGVRYLAGTPRDGSASWSNPFSTGPGSRFGIRSRSSCIRQREERRRTSWCAVKGGFSRSAACVADV